MARSRLIDPQLDIVSDPGAVLFSMVIGEQLEFPITLSFITDASNKSPNSNNYKYEAVVIEANNVQGQSTEPTTIKPSGVQTTLFVRIPFYAGQWTGSVGQVFNKEDVVLYNGVYYKKLTASSTATIAPDLNPTVWEVTALNKIYVRFPKDLGTTWTVAPTITSNTYGFFELRVTEPGASFPRTFKPVRGLIELLYSPTSAVTDPADNDYSNQGIYS
jgi:hypothetical protein